MAELFAAMAANERDLSLVAVGAPEGTTLPAHVSSTPPARGLPTNIGWMTTGLPRSARAARVDLFHAPAYTAPARSPRPLVLTIHDVSYERHPEWYPYRRDPFRRAFYRRSARAADCIVTDSQFSRAEIAAAYDLPLERIEVVPLAAAAAFVAGPSLPLPVNIPQPYLLHVGDLHRRRNLPVVLRALQQARSRGRLRDVALVCAGVRREEFSDDGGGVLGGGGVPVIFTGHTSESTLLALYRSATALVYPSRYEGFGLPVLEAMACGVPVISSDASCLPEVGGDAAVLIDPDDVDGWSRGIERVVMDAGYAMTLRRAGVDRASQFSWKRTAAMTAAVYRRLLAS